MGAVELLQYVTEIVEQRESLQDLHVQMTETVPTSLEDLMGSADEVAERAAAASHHVAAATETQSEETDRIESEVVALDEGVTQVIEESRGD